MTRTRSNAIVQVRAQSVMLARFGEAIGKTLVLNQIALDDILVQIDGYSETANEIVLAECWAHIGKAKVAQKHKIAADILKLSLTAGLLRNLHPDKAVKCFLIFADEDAADVVRSSSWLSAAAKHYGVVPWVVQLDDALVTMIRQAQKDQDLRDLTDVKVDAKAAGAK
jgi:hypothetical protein